MEAGNITQIGYELPNCDTIRFATEPTLIYRDDLNKLIKFYDDYYKQASQACRAEIARTKDYCNSELSRSREESWYGLTSRMKERTFDYLSKRTDYAYMDMYEEIRERVWGRLQSILRDKSVADISKPQFAWNEKELGIFSFDRASLGLKLKYCYYSPKYKQTFLDELVEIEISGDKTNYFLKSDKSKIVLSYEVTLHDGTSEYIDASNPLSEDDLAEINKRGTLALTSDIKNSFIHKEDKPKPKNAIRIFIDIGCNANINWEQKIYTGIAGVIATEFFEFKGYSVSVIPYIGYTRSGDDNKSVYRLVGYQAKKFSETLSVNQLLCSTADIAFFRTNFFYYAHLTSDFYKNKPYSGIGSNMDRSQKQCSIIQFFRNIDKNIDVYYLNFAEIYSEEQVLFFLTYLMFNIDNENTALNNAKYGTVNAVLTAEQIRQRTRDVINNTNT